MKKFQYDDFSPRDVWLVLRLDTQIEEQAADVYMLMDLPSGLILSHAITVTEGLEKQEAQDFFQAAFFRAKYWPQRVFIIKGDPVEKSLAAVAASQSFTIESYPAAVFDELVAPVKETFGQHIYSPSSVAYGPMKDEVDPEEVEAAKHFIPDAYDPCPCASGKKYKFCCKPIFREILEAMTEAEDGRKKKALKWLLDAKAKVGETGEVLCREAIVYSYFDAAECERRIDRCLELFPNHPRANYVKGINCREKGLLPEAIHYYQKAIENYPRTDRFHLNEAYNNIGTVYFDLDDYAGAKESWEKALFLLPSDSMVKRNLTEFIYSNPDLPGSVREISPMVKRLFEGGRQ